MGFQRAQGVWFKWSASSPHLSRAVVLKEGECDFAMSGDIFGYHYCGVFGYLVCVCEYLEAWDVAKYPTMHRRDPTPHALIFDRFSIEIDYLLRNVDQWLLSSTQVTHFILIGRSTVWGRRPGAFREKSPQRLFLLTVSILRL